MSYDLLRGEPVSYDWLIFIHERDSDKWWLHRLCTTKPDDLEEVKRAAFSIAGSEWIDIVVVRKDKVTAWGTRPRPGVIWS